jgi:hypothetical protein
MKTALTIALVWLCAAAGAARAQGVESLPAEQREQLRQRLHELKSLPP